MNGNFDKSVAIILEKRIEGGYSNHPWDKGGPTNWGITLKTLAAWRKRPVTAADVEAMPKSEALQIYLAWYWQPIQGDALPAGLDLCLFNAAVNVGVDTGAKHLQEILKVTIDGNIGPQTLFALKYANPEDVIARFQRQMVDYYRSLPGYRIDGNGWITRLFLITLKAALLRG